MDGAGLDGAAQDAGGQAVLTGGVEGGVRHPAQGAGSPSASASAPVPAVGELSSTAPTGEAAAVPSARSAAADQTALNRQLGGPVAKLAEAGPGERSVIVRVSPDTYGPVTVRATIGVDGSIRVELASATDAGREALRSGLADLRRDLAQVLGPNAQLSVDTRTDHGRSGAFGQGTGHGASPGGEAGSGTGQNGSGQNSASQSSSGQNGSGHNRPGGTLPRNASNSGAAGAAADGTAGVVLSGSAAGTGGLDVLA